MSFILFTLDHDSWVNNANAQSMRLFIHALLEPCDFAGLWRQSGRTIYVSTWQTIQ